MKRNRILFSITAVICYGLIGCVSEPDLSRDINNRPDDFGAIIEENTIRISILQEGREIRSGSGFAINYKQHKYVITNAHVIGNSDGDNIVIYKKVPGSGFARFYNTGVVAEDKDNDLAVLTFQDIEKSMQGLPVQYKRVMLQPVIAAGFPGGAEENDITFTTGRISNPAVKVEKRDRIKLDISVNPGNSGGPLVNEKGEVLGVVYMKYADNTAYAIPAAQALETIDGIEDNKHEKEIVKIAGKKLEVLMRSLIFNAKDELITANLFTYDYRLSIDSLFSSLYKLSQYITEEGKIKYPAPSGSAYPDFETLLLKMADKYCVFDGTLPLGKSAQQNNRLIRLGYQSIYTLLSEASKGLKEIEELEISAEKKDVYSKKIIEEYIRFYSDKLMNDIVYAHFDDNNAGDIKTIDNFEVVKVEPVAGEKFTVAGYIKIKYMDRIDNMKVMMKYSRGKWAISAIGSGVLGVKSKALNIKRNDPASGTKLAAYERSPEANSLYAGKVIPYRMWVDNSQWEEMDKYVNPLSEYEFMYKNKLLHGSLIAEKISVPLESAGDIVLLTMRQIVPTANLVFKEHRLVNGVEMVFLIIEYENNNLNYINCYHVYSKPSFGTIQVIAITLKSLYEKMKEEIIKFLNGISIADGDKVSEEKPEVSYGGR